MDKTHFNNRTVSGPAAWNQLVSELNWVGLTRAAAEKRWKNCNQEYRKFFQPPRTGGGNENQAHQKEPPEWIKRLDQWNSTKRSHNPVFLMDTAAEHLETRAKPPNEDGFGGAAGLSIANELLNDKNAIAGLNGKITEKKRKILCEMDFANFMKKQIKSSERSANAAERIAESIELLARCQAVFFQVEKPSHDSSYATDETVDY